VEVAAVWRYLSCCLDKRVLIGLGAIFAVIFLMAPHRALAVLPVLVALVCPVSMLLMMRAMNRDGSPRQPTEPVEAARDEQVRRLRAEIDELMAARPPADDETADEPERAHRRAGDDRPARAGGQR
jgi:hypothetical protein